MSTPSASDRRRSRNHLFGLNRSSSSSSSPLHLTVPESGSDDPNSSDGLKSLKKKSPISRFSSTFSHRSHHSKDEDHESSPNTLGGDAGSQTEATSPSNTDSPRDSFGPSSSAGRKPVRPTSVFGSLRSLRFGSDEEVPPLSAGSTASKTSTSVWKDFGGSGKDDLTNIGRNRTVLHHGEVQTSSGWIFKKKEYLVLTETHLVRYKNFSKVTENFPNLLRRDAGGQPELIRRHTSSQSVDSLPDNHSATSDASGERANAIPLNQIVSVYLNEDRPLQSVELSYLDIENGQGSALVIGVTDAEDQGAWLQNLRLASNKARLYDAEPVAQRLIDYAARVVEREDDYNIDCFKIYKVVRHTSRSSGRLSADESAKASPILCLLVIGVYKIHIIQIPKASLRGSTPSLIDLGDTHSYGILTVTWMSVSDSDDSFSLTFRFPFQKPRAYHLSSLAAVEIVHQLRFRDRALRPEWTYRSFGYNAPSPFEDDGPQSSGSQELAGWSEVLTAFCISYGVSPSIIRYAVEYNVEDGPQFILYPPDRPLMSKYSNLELLALLRSLRYNESFKSVCFVASLDCLNDVHDPHGYEFVSHYQKNGNPVGLSVKDQEKSAALVSELRALATSNPKLRRMDFSGSISYNVLSMPDFDGAPPGSGVVEALYPICRKQSTNVDWFVLNYIPLTELDVEYLAALAATKACHVRGVEISGCGLTDKNIDLVLDTLKSQANTLEAINISRNPIRFNPDRLGKALESFQFIRRLDLSYLVPETTSDPILSEKMLERWRLEDLRLSGIQLDDLSIRHLCKYLEHKNSETLKVLVLDGCSITGARAADILEAMSASSEETRSVALDLSENRLTTNSDRLINAIGQSQTPSDLAMRELDYSSDDGKLSDMFLALAKNHSLRTLDIGRISLTAEVSSAATTALGELFERNQSLVDLDISGEMSRLEHANLGAGILKALSSLKKNGTLEVLRIQHQKLGLPGASVLADIIRENRTLREIHCEENDITLSGFTDIVDALATNYSVLYIPSLEEGRATQLKRTEDQIRAARTGPDGAIMVPSGKTSNMRRTLAKIGLTESTPQGSVPPVPQWTQQDVQAALRLVSESWEGQVKRLDSFLLRNARIANGESIDTDKMPSDEAARPDTANSISKILDRMAKDRTPREEKQFDLSPALTDVEDTANLRSTTHARKTSVSSKSLPLLSPNVEAASPSAGRGPPAILLSAHSSPLGRPSLSEVDIDMTPVFEQMNPFDLIGVTDLKFPLVGEETIKGPSSHTQRPTSPPTASQTRMEVDARESHAGMDENIPPLPLSKQT